MSSDTQSDFEFYLRFVKPLIFNLQEPRDRALAAAWVQKLMNKDSGSEDLRTTYLKLLLFVLQRRKLRGIFLENPNHTEGLEQLSEANLHEVARDLLQAETDLKETSESGDFPPYCTDYSPDLLEYSAVQYIPNFGVHAYYAISNEPLPTWNRTEKAIFPRAIIKRSTTRVKITTSKFSVTESAPLLDEQGLTPSIRRTGSGNVVRRSLVSIQSKYKSRKDKPKLAEEPIFRRVPKRPNRSKVPLSRLLGVEVVEEEIREAPVWGTNVLPDSETPIWETAPDLLEKDSGSVCCRSSAYRDVPQQPRRTCPPCPSVPDPPRHSCGCPRSHKRPQTAAAPERENYYFSEYQTNYFQAVSLSNINPLLQPAPVPCRSPSPRRRPPVVVNERVVDANPRLYNFDFPGEGEINYAAPVEEIPVKMDDRGFTMPQEPSNFNIPYEGEIGGQAPILMDERNLSFIKKPKVYPNRRNRMRLPVPPEQINFEETEIRVIHPMKERNFTSVQSRSGFVLPRTEGVEVINSFADASVVVNERIIDSHLRCPSVDVACQSEERFSPPRGLAPIPERKRELYNFKRLYENQAEVNRFIEQTIVNTQKIDEDLEAFDRFISEYEKRTALTQNL